MPCLGFLYFCFFFFYLFSLCVCARTHVQMSGIGSLFFHCLGPWVRTQINGLMKTISCFSGWTSTCDSFASASQINICIRLLGYLARCGSSAGKEARVSTVSYRMLLSRLSAGCPGVSLQRLDPSNTEKSSWWFPKHWQQQWPEGP